MLENRILEVFQHSKLTRIEFADRLKISNAVLSHISSGRNKASTELVLAILKEFPEISTDWLLLGQGEMLRKDVIASKTIDILLNELQSVKNAHATTADRLSKLESEIVKLK
ncbi:MAG: helix-turn-helix domain-containing protein [Chitinophagaceae bacterium]